MDPAAVRLPRRAMELSWPDDLEVALRELDRPWTGGPFAEPAEELLAGAAGPVRRGLDTLDRQARATAPAANLVITHGEPHPGNIIRVAADGAGGRAGQRRDHADRLGHGCPGPARARPVDGGHRDRRRAAPLHRTHRPPVEPAAIELYRLRWALDDLSCFVRDLRAPHRRTPGTEHAWESLQITVDQILAPPQPRPIPPQLRWHGGS